MSAPIPSSPVPSTPQEAFGIPDSPLPRFPRLGGSRSGARRRSGGPGGGLPKNPLGRPGHAPGSAGSTSERRQRAKENLTLVRSQPRQAPPAAPAKHAKSSQEPQPGRTAHGAPERNPREIPKTGRAQAIRDAVRHGMSHDTRRMHEGMSAEEQEEFNKLSRADQDIRRRELREAAVQRMRDLRDQAQKDDRMRRKRRGAWRGIDATMADMRGGAEPAEPPSNVAEYQEPAKPRRKRGLLDQIVSGKRYLPDEE